MDVILTRLQNRAFDIPSSVFEYLSGLYEKLAARDVPELLYPGFHPSVPKTIIGLHREQFRSDEYVNSRIADPTTGTLDHLHAEITADLAVRLAASKGYTGYAPALLRMAGHLHDADRSFPETMVQGEKDVRHDTELYAQYKRLHAESSVRRAEEMRRQCRDEGIHMPIEFGDDLDYLISRHESGGQKINGRNSGKPSDVDGRINLNDLADLLTDADSLSYFQANIFTNWQESGRDEQALVNKMQFMYTRTTSAARVELNRSVLQSGSHFLGPDGPDIEDVAVIRRLVIQTISASSGK